MWLIFTWSTPYFQQNIFNHRNVRKGTKKMFSEIINWWEKASSSHKQTHRSVCLLYFKDYRNTTHYFDKNIRYFFLQLLEFSRTIFSVFGFLLISFSFFPSPVMLLLSVWRQQASAIQVRFRTVVSGADGWVQSAQLCSSSSAGQVSVRPQACAAGRRPTFFILFAFFFLFLLLSSLYLCVLMTGGSALSLWLCLWLALLCNLNFYCCESSPFFLGFCLNGQFLPVSHFFFPHSRKSFNQEKKFIIFISALYSKVIGSAMYWLIT